MNAILDEPPDDTSKVPHTKSVVANRKKWGLFAPADLDDPDVKGLIIRLALPSVLGLSANALHHVANAAFIGGLGADAVAAVSIALPIFMLVAAIGHGLGTGAAALIGRLLGAKEEMKANIAATTALGLTVPIGLACSLCLFLWQDPILLLFGATPSILPLARDYVSFLAVGCGLILLQILCDFIVIAEGNSRLSMWTLVAGFGLNIVLDPIFIFAFGWGIKGAALASMTSQAIALAAFAIYFTKRIGNLRIAAEFYRPTSAILRPILRVGIPTSLTSATAAFAFALLFHNASAYGGDTAVAAIGVAFRLSTFGELPIVGFCIGAQSLLGYAFGSGAYVRLRSAVHIMLVTTSIFAGLYALVMISLATAVMGLFTDDPAVTALGAKSIRTFHALFFFFGIQLVLLVLLQSLDKAKEAALVSLAPQGYFLVSCLLVLPPLWKLDGVIASPAAALALTAGLSLALLQRELRNMRQMSQLSQ